MMETSFKRALQRSLLSAVTVNIIITAATTYAVKCLKDATVPDTYAINVYYCEDASKPVCCKSSSTASLADSCCEQNTWVSMRNQIILWSVLFGLVATVVTVWLCYRKDNYICEGDPMIVRCFRCCRVSGALLDTTLSATKESMESHGSFDNRSFSAFPAPVPTLPPIDQGTMKADHFTVDTFRPKSVLY